MSKLIYILNSFTMYSLLYIYIWLYVYDLGLLSQKKKNTLIVDICMYSVYTDLKS